MNPGGWAYDQIKKTNKLPYYMEFSRHVNFAILRNTCTLNHFNFAIFSEALFI